MPHSIYVFGEVAQQCVIVGFEYLLLCRVWSVWLFDFAYAFSGQRLGLVSPMYLEVWSAGRACGTCYCLASCYSFLIV